MIFVYKTRSRFQGVRQMKWFLILLAFALGFLCMAGLSSAADAPPPLVIDWTSANPADTAAVQQAFNDLQTAQRDVSDKRLQLDRVTRACIAGQCAAPGIQRGQPLRNTGRIAVVVRKRVAAIRPFRRLGAAFVESRAGRVAVAPIRWLRR
jgi:hypothetical protein